MPKKNSARRAKCKFNVDPFVLVAASVLAQLPEKMRVLADAIRAASAAIGTDKFNGAHDQAKEAYSTVNNLANHSWNALDPVIVRGDPETVLLERICLGTQKRVEAIYKATGNFFNRNNFEETFSDIGTVEAVADALAECGDEIRTIVRKYGF